METVLAILGVGMLLLGIFLSLRPYVHSPIPSYAGVWLLQWSGLLDFQTVILSYWGIMVAIVVTVSALLPPALVKATQGLPHIVVSSIAGMLIGITIGYKSMIIGAVVGAAAGAAFFAKTRKGAALRFPSQRFVQYLCAKGFPTVISVALAGIVILVAIKQLPGA